jgi:hypothetical protein
MNELYIIGTSWTTIKKKVFKSERKNIAMLKNFDKNIKIHNLKIKKLKMV